MPPLPDQVVFFLAFLVVILLHVLTPKVQVGNDVLTKFIFIRKNYLVQNSQCTAIIYTEAFRMSLPRASKNATVERS